MTISKYTKHYYIGSERVANALGSIKSLGMLCEGLAYADAALIAEMNNKVEYAAEVMRIIYDTFEKDMLLPAPFFYNEVFSRCDRTHYQDMYHPYWYHPDHLGSSSYITNLAGTVSQHMEYLPFGELLVDEHLNSHNSPFKFNAKEFDTETGNYYYGARYYNPKWQLWLSVDAEFAKFPSWSPYNYTLQNPVRYIDPDGNSPDDIIIRGRNGNTITIPTADYNHRYVDVPFDIAESQTMDLGLSNVNTNNVAAGYSIGLSAEAKATYGGKISGNLTVVNFPTSSEYSDYNYVYAGGELSGSGGVQAGANANIEANFFVAYSNDRENIKPSYFEGKASTYGLSFDVKAVAGGGVSVYGFQSEDKSWTGVGVGLNIGVGKGATIGAWTRGESYSVMLSNEIPTANRSRLDRVINNMNGKPMVYQAIFQYIEKNINN